MADVLFISENYLKQNSVINDNVDMKILTPTIIWVQDNYIQKILGQDLFEEMQSQITAAKGTNARAAISHKFEVR